jgi:serine kinase of HPr protein (carbohydrate metabolism regulator)
VVEEAFAPRTTLHGSWPTSTASGLLFMGRSGIGKSECVLDLVERGHRLVADDVVQVVRRGNDVLIGRGHELAAHHMEIRGIGLIDIPALFGVRSVRQQKRIEVVVPAGGLGERQRTRTAPVSAGKRRRSWTWRCRGGRGPSIRARTSPSSRRSWR